LPHGPIFAEIAGKRQRNCLTPGENREVLVGRFASLGAELSLLQQVMSPMDAERPARRYDAERRNEDEIETLAWLSGKTSRKGAKARRKWKKNEWSPLPR
jgi:hypothetical protein